MKNDFDAAMTRKPARDWGHLAASALFIGLLILFVVPFMTPRETPSRAGLGRLTHAELLALEKATNAAYGYSAAPWAPPRGGRQPTGNTSSEEESRSPAPNKAKQAKPAASVEVVVVSVIIRWGLAILLAGLVAVVALIIWLVRKLRNRRGSVLRREFRYIKRNAKKVATPEEFHRVKDAWEHLLAYYGLSKLQHESLTQQAERAAQQFGFARSTLLQFARACDNETYGNVALSASFRQMAVAHYIELFGILPEAARAMPEH